MSYNIANYSSCGLCIAGEKEISDFAEKVVSVIKEKYKSWYSNEDLFEKMSAAVFSETELTKKVKNFGNFLDSADVDQPFGFGLEVDETDPDHRRPILIIGYDEINRGSRWQEEIVEPMVKVFAPFMEEGAYLGFIGEDGGMWSYVFDGKGSYIYSLPAIDWRGGFNPADD